MIYLAAKEFVLGFGEAGEVQIKKASIVKLPHSSGERMVLKGLLIKDYWQEQNEQEKEKVR